MTVGTSWDWLVIVGIGLYWLVKFWYPLLLVQVLFGMNWCYMVLFGIDWYLFKEPNGILSTARI